eukprot:1154065-Pelagomonas_calceolata.AAC.2
MSGFKLRDHCSKVESCKGLGGSNVCDKCERPEAQDEKHPLHTFAQLPNADFMTFLASFHILNDLENWFQSLMLDENVSPVD